MPQRGGQLPRFEEDNKFLKAAGAISEGFGDIGAAASKAVDQRQRDEGLKEEARQHNDRLQLEKDQLDLKRKDLEFANNTVKATRFNEMIIKMQDFSRRGNKKAAEVYRKRLEENPNYRATYDALGFPAPDLEVLVNSGEDEYRAFQDFAKGFFDVHRSPDVIKDDEYVNRFLSSASRLYGPEDIDKVQTAISNQKKDAEQSAERQEFERASRGGRVGGRVLSKEGAAGLQLEAQPSEEGGFKLQSRPETKDKAKGLGEGSLKGVTGNLSLLRSQVGIEDQLDTLEQEYKRTKNPLNKPGPLQGRVNNILSSVGLSTDNYIKFRSLANQGALERIKTLSGVQYTDKQLKYLATALPSEIRTPAQIRSMSKALKQVAVGGLIDDLTGAALGGQFAEPSELAGVLKDNAAQLEIGPLVKPADIKNLISRSAWNSQEELNEFVSGLPEATIKALKSGK